MKTYNEIENVFSDLGLEVPTGYDPETILQGLYRAVEWSDRSLQGGGRSEKKQLDEGWVHINPKKVDYHSRDLIEMIKKSKKLPNDIKNWALDITRQQKDIPDLIEEILLHEGLLEKPYIVVDKPVREI